MYPLMIIISLVLIVSGMLLYLLASRIPRNLLFGFRIGYTLSSRRLWVKYNRLSGLTLVLTGVVVLFLSMFITNLMVFILVILGMTIGSTIVLVYMASREAERELGFRAVEPGEVVGEKIRRITPVKPSPSRILFAILPPILSGIASEETFSRPSPLVHSALTGASTVFVMVMVTVTVADLVTVLKAVAVVNSVFVISLVTVL